jgi:hypothetical protein
LSHNYSHKPPPHLVDIHGYCAKTSMDVLDIHVLSTGYWMWMSLQDPWMWM